MDTTNYSTDTAQENKTQEYKMVSKCWRLNLSKIEDGFFHSEFYGYATDRGKAKNDILKQIKYETMVDTDSGSEITLFNIPVLRAKEMDMYSFEKKELTLESIEKIKTERKRVSDLNEILDNDSVKFCYVKKGYSYYCDNSCGYTTYKTNAGVYTKKEAFDEALSCDKLTIIPIDIELHNASIKEKIEFYQKRLIV